MRLLALIGVLAALSGCTVTPATPCYGLVGINPPSRTAIIFDQCRGEVLYQTLPPLSTDEAPS